MLELLTDTLTDVLLWMLQRLNKYKSRTLSFRLHNIADRYDTRPTGQWSYEQSND